MKKLLLLSLVLVGLMSLASCKKVLAPSAITAENTVANVVITGVVKFQYGGNPLTANSDIAKVTATAEIGGSQYTFTVHPNEDGSYSLAIPIKYNLESIHINKIEAVVDLYDVLYKGKLAGFDANKNDVVSGKNITCTPQ